MSYSGQSNPPWQRNNLTTNAGAQGIQTNQIGTMNNMHFQQNSNNQMFQNYGTSAAGGGNQNSVGGLTNLNQLSQSTPIFNQTAPVSYPQSRGLNPLAFNQAVMNQQSLVGQHNQQQKQTLQHKIGYVTKLHTDCGFVDDEIFFHLKVCSGSTPKLGDRVLVEAAFNPNSPFKWNASRIQVITISGTPSNNNVQHKQQQKTSHHQQLQQSARSNPQQLPSLLNMKPGGSGYNAVPPPNEYRGPLGQRGFSPNSKRSPERRKDSKTRADRDRNNDDELDRKKRREERDRSRERRERRDVSIEKRDRSPIRRQSPKRRRTRTTPRYMVEIPKITLNLSKADVLELRRRYKNLYLPSDFFYTHIKWSESFPPNNPFLIQRPCTFHVMHKSVEQPKHLEISTAAAILEPNDLDYSFSAKVMLMGFPPIVELYQKSLAINGNHQQDERDEERECIHPSRLINFLVGIRGKNETMAIGGPWSPSLDGPNPQKDPTVLIRTAIRNCRALTGIDLSQCTQWYRFVELYYHRSESIYKGKTIPARVETVVIYLPDINSCMPTRTEWTNLQDNYKTKLDQIILLNQENCNSSSSIVIGSGSGTASSSTFSSHPVVGADEKDSTGVVAVETGTKDGGKLKPTHYSQLDVKQMKIQNLRDELLSRNLPAKGLRPQLAARLTKAINAEKAAELEENATADEENKISNSEDEIKETENDNSDVKEIIDENADNNDESVIEVDMTDIVVLDEYDATKSQEDNNSQKERSKLFDEKERAQLERRYKFPESPHIIVHPSATAKSGKFDCTVMSLSVLLDYRPEDTKERSFEVSLFAELFNEMLMRDFGYNIYKELITLPEKVKEKEDDKKKTDESNKMVSLTSTNDDDDKSKDGSNILEKPKETLDKKTGENVGGGETKRETKLNENENKKVDKKDDKLRDKKTTKRTHEDETDDDAHSIRSDRKKKLKPLSTYVAKKELLMSFVYFDTSHCGFIYEKDLEELFHIIGLNLSRGQIRKLLSKAVSKDAVHYRKLTDKSKDDETGKSPENLDANDLIVPKIEEHKSFIGNLTLLPIFDTKINANISNKKEEINGTNNTSMIVHNGCLLDVDKLVEQMKRSEKAREEIEQILSDLKKQNLNLQSGNAKSNSKIKDLQSETKGLNKKLRETEDNLFSITRKYNEHHSIIQSIHDKISPIFAKALRDKERNERKDERDTKMRDDRDKKENRDKKDDRGDKKDEIDVKKDIKIRSGNIEERCSTKEIKKDIKNETSKDREDDSTSTMTTNETTDDNNILAENLNDESFENDIESIKDEI